jgi:peptidoglycan/xylan/chitin deacetylase (PgdA/CDA1 family)
MSLSKRIVKSPAAGSNTVPASVFFQPKLTVNSPADRYEQEADAVAEHVMQMKTPVIQKKTDLFFPPLLPSITRVQRKCDQCEKEKKEMQRKEINGAETDVNDSFESYAGTLSQSGQTLPGEVRSFFEPRFGYDFSNVKVHTDLLAAQSAQSINALAYTSGNNIVFNQGAYSPDTESGKKLLGHELTHVVQQNTTIGTKAIQRVQLSYDDGPDNAGNTRAVLTALNSAGARATFYLVGQRVLEGTNYQVVFDIAASGNWLGNHAFDWNNATDNHIFMSGTMEERALKILETEVAIRSALTRGKQEAVAGGRWTNIPQANKDYIDDVIAFGTGRFRTPGFRSHIYSPGGITQQAAIELANRIAAAVGIRQFVASDSVDVDPEDWRAGRTSTQISDAVRSGVDENSDSILLHSRVSATASATPAITADIGSRAGFTWDAGARGTLDRRRPSAGFAGMSTISNPPTHSEMMTARNFLVSNFSVGPIILGETAIGILQMAQGAGGTEVRDFLDFIETTPGPTGTGFIANFLLQNASFRITYLYLTYSLGRRSLPTAYQAGGRPPGR